MTGTNHTLRIRLIGWGLGLLVAWAAAPATAEVVYSWTTDDGTLAFTDDQKKIPARYEKVVKERTLESLRSYPRLTIEAPAVRPVAPVAPVRQAVTSRSAQQAVSPEDGLSVVVGGTRYGANATVVPVGSHAEDAGPTIIREFRVKPRDSMATTHQTVITRDGRVISIQRDELNQADYTGMVPPVR